MCVIILLFLLKYYWFKFASVDINLSESVARNLKKFFIFQIWASWGFISLYKYIFRDMCNTSVSERFWV